VVSNHVVRAGESLQSISAAYYGSSAYWYLIAEANGLDGTEELTAGTTLSIPNTVANSVNDKDSYKVYSESEIIGSTSPEVRVKKKKRSFFKRLVQVIIAAIIIYVVTVLAPYAAGAAYNAVGGVLGLLAGAAAAYGVGMAGSVVTQGVAIATGLQEEFDWEAARDMGKSAVISVAFGKLTGMAGTGNETGQVLGRGAIELGRQYVENDGKITNWTGVALAMVGSKVDPESRWASTLSDLNENREVLGTTLSVIESGARGNDAGLSWTNAAAAMISASGGSQGRYFDNQTGFQWGAIAREGLINVGLSLIVNDRYGGDAAANFLGTQLGSLGIRAMQDRADSQVSALEIAHTASRASESASQLQGLNQNAEQRGVAERDRVLGIAEEQQSDANWALDAPDEGRSGVIDNTYTAGPNSGRLNVRAVKSGEGGVSQTTPADFAGFEAVAAQQEGSVYDFLHSDDPDTHIALDSMMINSLSDRPMSDSPVSELIGSVVGEYASGSNAFYPVGKQSQVFDQGSLDRSREIFAADYDMSGNGLGLGDISAYADRTRLKAGYQYYQGHSSDIDSEIPLRLVIRGEDQSAKEFFTDIVNQVGTRVSDAEFERLAGAVLQGDHVVDISKAHFQGSQTATTKGVEAYRTLVNQGIELVNNELDMGLRESYQHYLENLQTPNGLEHSLIGFLSNDRDAPASVRDEAKGFIYGSIGQDILNTALLYQGTFSALKMGDRLASLAKQEAVGQLRDSLRFRMLGLDKKGFDAAEAIGGVRLEQYLGRRIERSVDPAVDFIDKKLGRIDLKGPLADPKTGVLVPQDKMDVTGLAKSVVKEHNFSSASQTIVVDTLGMSKQQIDLLKQTVQSSIEKQTKNIIYIE
jgi:drug/metabolite transporter superfamily protein YnfA